MDYWDPDHDSMNRISNLTRFRFIEGSFLAALGLVLSAISSPGHGDSHEMIQAVTAEIQQKPRDPDLYFRRAELYRRHGDFDLALADYNAVERWSKSVETIDLVKGLLFSEAKWPNTAKSHLDQFLAQHPNHAIGLTARAQVFLQLQDREAAVKDFTSAIQASAEPRPELFIQRAEARLGEKRDHIPEALKGLDEGIARLGQVVTLQLYAIDLELRQSQTNAALNRLDALLAKSPRKETWYARKGEILHQASRWNEARDAYSQALEHLKTLPAAKRNVPAMQELERRIRAALEAVQKQESPTPRAEKGI